MSAILGTDHRSSYRSTDSALPERPISLPYEIRSEMTLLDFSNPINPLGAPSSFIQQMHTALVDGELGYAPDRDGREFRRIVSSAIGVTPDSILLGSTPSQLMTYAAMAFELTTVGVSTPCPAEYLSAMANAGHNVKEISSRVSSATPDAYTARERFGEFEGALLGSPSYPVSRLLSHNTLLHYLETCNWVIVDESNIELSFGAESCVKFVDRYPNLIVIRNPSVTFAMPGVPISYIVAHPETIATISQFYDGSDVNMFAEVLAGQMASSYDYLEQTHEFLDAEIPWMQCHLSLIPGITITPAEGNFIMCRFNPSSDLRLAVSCVEELVIRLQLAGFYVQHLRNTPGLCDDSYFSLSVRLRDDNQRLLIALRSIVSGTR